MKNITNSLQYKVLAIFLFTFLSAGFAFTLTAAAFLITNTDVYSYYMYGFSYIFLNPIVFYESLMPYRAALIIFCVVCAAGCIAILIYLCCSAGRRHDSAEVKRNIQDRIPYDIYISLTAAVAVALVYFFASVSGYLNEAELFLVFDFFFVLLSLVALSLILTTATRIKTRTLIKNTVIYRILHFIFMFVYKVWSNMGILWKAIIALIAYVFLNSILVISSSTLAFFALNVVVFAFVCYMCIQYNSIIVASNKISSGDLNYKLRTDKLFGIFRKLALNLNSIGEGLSRAVESEIKSERLKAELITNVSHDIKTPLTSIVNYVDLLKKEDISNPNAKEYLEILDRQSERLKKLTVDLVEVSKASTGNMPVDLAITDYKAFILQATGEYVKRFEVSGLELVVEMPEENIIIMADGKLLWRVFDNLLSNACKYAQQHTRVYIGVETMDGKASVFVKNVSRNKLNISPDELMERFVRGDTSRATEGSGLGLSIARSLTELQRGKFNIFIDGDLIKIEVKFDLVDLDADEAEMMFS